MLRCSIGLTCVLWAACSFGQSSPMPIAAGSTAKVACKSESEEVVLHATASAPIPIVDILPCGAEVMVVAKETDWYRVRAQDGKEGYVKDVFLAATLPIAQTISRTGGGYIVCTPGVSGVHLLESPKGVATNTKMPLCGEKIDVLEELPDKDSYKIETSGGNVGYVWRGSVSWSPPFWAKAQDAAPYARPSSPAEQATRHIKDGYINCDPEANGVHLYESTEALRAIMMVHCGEKIAVLEEIQREHGNWDKIETSGGSVGYLFSGFVSSNPPTVDAGALEAQYKTCAKHSIPADNCTLEVYYQLRDKDEPQGAAAAQGLVDVAGVNQAIQGTIMMRDGVRDPTSFTVLQVLLEPNGGCVHYVASNAFGGRVQQWGVYSMDKKGRITVALNLQFQYYIDWCVKSSWRDVTAEVKKAISQGDGR